MSLPLPSSPPLSSPLSLLLPSALFSCPAFVALALFSHFCPLAHLFTSKHGSSSVVAHHSSRDLMLKLLQSSCHSSQVWTTSPEPSGSLSYTLPMTAITMYRESGYILGITSKTNILTTYKRKIALIRQLLKKRHEPSNYINPIHPCFYPTLPSAGCHHRHLMLLHHPSWL
jgi:hypothetical protein